MPFPHQENHPSIHRTYGTPKNLGHLGEWKVKTIPDMTKPLFIDATCGGYPLQAQKSLILKRFTKRTLEGKNTSWFYRNDEFPRKHICRFFFPTKRSARVYIEHMGLQKNPGHLGEWKVKTIPSLSKTWQKHRLSMPLVGGTLCKPKNLWFWSILHKELYKEKIHHDFIGMMNFLQNIFIYIYRCLILTRSQEPSIYT